MVPSSAGSLRHVILLQSCGNTGKVLSFYSLQHFDSSQGKFCPAHNVEFAVHEWLTIAFEPVMRHHILLALWKKLHCVVGKWKREQELKAPNPLQTHAFNDLTSSHKTLSLKTSTASQLCCGLGTKTTREFLRYTYPNYRVPLKEMVLKLKYKITSCVGF